MDIPREQYDKVVNGLLTQLTIQTSATERLLNQYKRQVELITYHTNNTKRLEMDKHVLTGFILGLRKKYPKLVIPPEVQASLSAPNKYNTP